MMNEQMIDTKNMREETKELRWSNSSQYIEKEGSGFAKPSSRNNEIKVSHYCI